MLVRFQPGVQVILTVKEIINTIEKIRDRSADRPEVRINDGFILELMAEDRASLHIDDVAYQSIGEKLAILRNGLKGIVIVLKNDPEFQKVEVVEGISWIVAIKPKLLERLGFTIDNDSPDAERARKTYKARLKNSVIHMDKRDIEPSYAYISKDKLLELYE